MSRKKNQQQLGNKAKKHFQMVHSNMPRPKASLSFFHQIRSIISLPQNTQSQFQLLLCVLPYFLSSSNINQITSTFLPKQPIIISQEKIRATRELQTDEKAHFFTRQSRGSNDVQEFWQSQFFTLESSSNMKRCNMK